MVTAPESVWNDAWGYARATRTAEQDEARSARPAWAGSNSADRPDRSEYADLEEQQ